MTAPTVAAPSADRRPVPLVATVASEWMKLKTLRATWVTLVVGSLIGFALTALLAAVVGATWRDWPPEELAGFEPVMFSLVGTLAPGIAMVVLAVKAVTSEYSTGMAHLTMTITPRRERVLLAKAVVVSLVTLVVATVTNVASYLIGQAFFAAAGLPADGLTDPEVARALVVVSLLGPIFPLLALALAVLIRGTAGAVTAALALIMLPSFLGPALPAWWQTNVLSYLPGPASDSLAFSHLPGSPAYHSTAVSLAVLAGWLLVFGTLAFVTLNRRDV